MLFKFELEGGNFSKAGYASSQIKKVLKQLAIDPRIIKRVVVALYEANAFFDKKSTFLYKKRRFDLGIY